MSSIIKASAAALLTSVAFAGTASAELTGDLKIYLDTSNPAPRATMEELIKEFGEANPDLNIETNIIDREAYKTQIRNFLTADAPDVATWYAGNRMGPYVEAGLFEDVSDIWDEQFSADLASTKPSMTMDGKQYGVPYTYYQWGVYYRKDIFEQYGLSEPKTWAEEIANCQTLLDNGVKCYTIGTKYLWTAGGWFDYLSLRTHGYEFHMDLTAGKISWEDDRVKEIFANWRTLIDMGAFVDNHTSYSWQEALPFMVQGDAASYLMGNFAVAQLREAGLTDDQLDYYQFPLITEGIPMAEDAPTDTFHIPSQAKNKENARAFLKYVASADVQTDINQGSKLGQLPVNKNSAVDDDKFLQEGFEVLSNAAGLAQFFDRDAPAEMAKAGMEGFQEFMVKPDNLDQILARLEKTRGQVYK
ncbi:ABC transporter substrate-binding protein [Falsihalocynthiibacter sp. SS001]|uniref:ABC transporter substrate-binding protein n=1 Tax=Falsihalocynthiibacter sp. SS001 TaxID=3349698 RepID=UPI0036D3B0B2